MDSQGSPRDGSLDNPIHISTSNPPALGGELRAQPSTIPPPSFFAGFPHHGSQMPFLFPHSFMPPHPSVGFAPQVPSAVAAGSQKRDSLQCATNQSQSTKKRRVARKNPEIVELDDAKDEVEVLKSAGHWKDHWVIQLISIRGEMHSTFSQPPKQGVDNWSRLNTKLVSLCPDFPKDSEACRKKWSVIYNDYKEDKTLNLKSGSQRSDKCRWFQFVDEFMYDRANVVSHAHASAVGGDGVKCASTSTTNVPDFTIGDSLSKSPEPKRKEEMFMERCVGEIRESSKNLMETLKTNDEMKMTLLISMQQIMREMVDKM